MPACSTRMRCFTKHEGATAERALLREDEKRDGRHSFPKSSAWKSGEDRGGTGLPSLCSDQGDKTWAWQKSNVKAPISSKDTCQYSKDTQASLQRTAVPTGGLSLPQQQRLVPAKNLHTFFCDWAQENHSWRNCRSCGSHHKLTRPSFLLLFPDLKLNFSSGVGGVGVSCGQFGSF